MCIGRSVAVRNVALGSICRSRKCVTRFNGTVPEGAGGLASLPDVRKGPEE